MVRGQAKYLTLEGKAKDFKNCLQGRPRGHHLYYYENNPSIFDNVWFSDETVFHLSGRVNRHNTRIWGTENPKVIEEKERDSPKLVWCD